MEAETPKVTPVLETAWRRYAQLDALSLRRSRAYQRLHLWVTILGVFIILFAILTAVFFSNTTSLAGLVLKIFLVSTPLIVSALAALGTRAFRNGDWLITRAAAEQYLREIYFYRTILQKQTARDTHLESRMGEIQRRLYRALGSERVFRPFKARIPPYYDPANPNSDPGFNELNGDEYFRYRLKDQLHWHTRKVTGYHRQRTVFTLLVLVAGAFSILLATFGGPLGIWVALTAAITAGLVSWQQFRNLEAVIKNYSTVILRLTSIHDHWTTLEPEERTPAEFYAMVRECEDVLCGQNAEYVRSMQEALQESGLEKEASLIEAVIKESVESAERTQQALRDEVVTFQKEVLQKTEEQVMETFKAMLASLAEEASSEIVRLELEAMRKAAAEMAKNQEEEPSGEAAPPDDAPTPTEPTPPKLTDQVPVEQIAFTAYHPKEGRVLVWHPLIIYIHAASEFRKVRQDVLRYIDQIKVPKEVTQTSTTRLARGTKITIVPACEGITFNPEHITVTWLEDFQRADFRFSAAESLLDDAARGHIDFFVGPLIVGSLKFAMLFNDNQEQSMPDKVEQSEMYQKDAIFVSYSHKDTKIVEAFKLVHQATGYDVLIDIDNLRSGHEWSAELMRLIDRADIFQLFWSQNSSQSKYCQQEWQHALKRNKEGFIRPVYWQLPLPNPPQELAKYHFEYVQIENDAESG